MAGRSIQQLIATNKNVLHLLAAQTTSAVQGTQSTHAHGLVDFNGNALVPAFAIVQETATAVDHATTGLPAGRVHVVSMDATNVTVRSEVASSTFSLLVG